MAQAVKDAATFLASELPAVSDWTFGPAQATAITCPVLFVLGSKTSRLFVEGHELLHEWFPQCHNADIPTPATCSRWKPPDPSRRRSPPIVPTLFKHHRCGSPRRGE
jgi:hypothetical protein